MKSKNFILILFLVAALVFWVAAAPVASAQQAGGDDAPKNPPKRAAADKKPAPPEKKMSIEERLERLEKSVRQLGAAMRQSRRDLDSDRPRTDEPGKARAGRKGNRGAPSAEEQGRRRAGRIDPRAEGRGRQGARPGRGAVRGKKPDDRFDAGRRGVRNGRPQVRRPGARAGEIPEKARELRERLRDDVRRPLQGLKRAEILKKLRDLRLLREKLEQQPEPQKRLRERIRDPEKGRGKALFPPQDSGS